MMNLPVRPRRNRKSAGVRGLMRETALSAEHLIYPMFVQEGEENTPIESLPGCTRWCVADIAAECRRLFELGIPCVDLFAVVPEVKKDAAGSEAWNPQGVVPRAIRAIKTAVPEMVVMTDVALDPFNTYGQDGIVREYEDGAYEILNDETVEALVKQALCHARAGADIISPSDMMDGRIAALRAALDAEGFEKVSLMSYTAKYASIWNVNARHVIDPDKCKGCTACARNCPVGAIHGTVKNPHEIDQNACIKCGTCIEKCKFNAISIK